MSATMSATSAPKARQLRDVAFVVLMLVLTGLFAALGVWQWQRLSEKEALIVKVESRMARPPSDLPAADQWPTLDTDFYNYRPLIARGQFLPAQTVLVFTSLGSARGSYSGPGYWVMTPVALESGGTLFANRGFVPQASGPAFASGGATPTGTVTIMGVGRTSEEAGNFTPGADASKRVEWVRDTARLARLVDPGLAPFAPLYLDLPAGQAGALPQGGETVVDFANNHLGYALTWFGFALLTPVLLFFWQFRQRRTPTSR